MIRDYQRLKMKKINHYLWIIYKPSHNILSEFPDIKCSKFDLIYFNVIILFLNWGSEDILKY